MTEYSKKEDYTGYIFASILIVFFVSCIGIPIEQFYQWLKTGVAPERNLFWIMNFIYATDYSFYEFTGWVGLNKIINYIFNIHLAVLGFIYCAVCIHFT